VVVLTEEGPTRQLFEDLGIRVVHIPIRDISDAVKRPFWSLRSIKNWLAFFPNKDFVEFFQREKPDIVHLNDSPLLSAGITASHMGIPIVWHIRGVIPQQGSLRRKLLIKRIFQLSTKVIAITEDEANQFGPSTKVQVIYNSVNPEAIEVARNTGYKFRSEIQCKPDYLLIGAVIHLTPEKGAWDFIRAAGITRKLCPNTKIKFVIAGHAPTHRRKLHRIRDLTGFIGLKHPLDYAWELAGAVGVKDDLIITGFRSDVFTVIDALDIVVFPSRLNSIGRAAIEGSALGKPIVATVPQKVTGLVIDGQTGLLTTPGDPQALARAFVRLIQDPLLAHKMGEAGRVYALEYFDARRNIEPVHQIYEEILNARNG
jgi:glycosyltransferase involved in cell wall biosynthesis